MKTSYREFATGWPVLLCAFLGIGLGLSPVPFYTIGMTAPHMATEFGWSFKAIMGGVPLMTLGLLLGGPMAGILADRFGVRIVTLTSVVIFSLSIMAFGLGTGSLPLYYATWLVMSVGGAATLPITWTRPISSQFTVHRGLALGLALVGTGVFGFFIKPFAAWLIESYGWRQAYFVIGAMPLLIALPVALAFFRDDKGAPSDVGKAVARRTDGMPLGQALKSWPFWAIFIAFLPIAAAIAGPIPNMENLLKTKGFTMDAVTALVPLIGLSVIVGRLAGGWLIDRFWAPGVALVLLGISAVGCLLLAQSGTAYAPAAVAIFMIGFAAGMEYDLLAYLTTRYFGLAAYGAIYGVLYCAFGIGSGLGPVLYGAVFDQTGNYTLAVQASAVMLFGGALLLLTCGRYRKETPAPEEAEQVSAAPVA